MQRCLLQLLLPIEQPQNLVESVLGTVALLPGDALTPTRKDDKVYTPQQPPLQPILVPPTRRQTIIISIPANPQPEAGATPR